MIERNMLRLIIIFTVVFTFDCKDVFSQINFIPYKCKNKWGYIKNDSLIIPCLYDEVTPLMKDSLFKVKLDGKFGVINLSGKTILDHVYDDLRIVRQNLFLVQIENQWGVVDEYGKFIIPVEYEELYEEDPFEIFRYIKNTQQGLIKFSGESITNENYVNLIVDEDIQMYVFQKKYNGKYGLLDKFGNEILKQKYNRIILYKTFAVMYSKKGSWMLDLKKMERISKVYDYIEVFTNDFTWFVKENLYGFIDKTGKEIIPAMYNDATLWPGNKYLNVKLNGKWGMINSNNENIIKFQYQSIIQFDSLVVFKKEDKYGLMDVEENILIENKYEQIGCLNNYLWEVSKDGYFGVFNLHTNSLSIPIKYDDLSNIDSKQQVLIRAKKNDFYGVITPKDETIIDFKYKRITSFKYPNMLFVSYTKTLDDGFFIDFKGREYTVVD